MGVKVDHMALDSRPSTVSAKKMAAHTSDDHRPVSTIGAYQQHQGPTVQSENDSGSVQQRYHHVAAVVHAAAIPVAACF